MNDFHYANPVNIYFGKSAVEELPSLVGEHKVMLVYGGGSAKANGAYDTIARVLSRNHTPWIDFGGNTQPSYQRALEAIVLCKAENVGCVIGIGGCTCPVWIWPRSSPLEPKMKICGVTCPLRRLSPEKRAAC